MPEVANQKSPIPATSPFAQPEGESRIFGNNGQILDILSLLLGIGDAAMAAVRTCAPPSAFSSSGQGFRSAGAPDAGKDLDATIASIAEIGLREIEMPAPPLKEFCLA